MKSIQMVTEYLSPYCVDTNHTLYGSPAGAPRTGFIQRMINEFAGAVTMGQMDFTVEGAENLEVMKKIPTVLAGYPHTGHQDAAAFGRALPSEFRPLVRVGAAGDYWYQKPALRYLMSAFVHGVPVERNCRSSNPLEPLANILKQGNSLFLLPEGTRSLLPDCKRKLKTGTVSLMAELDIPVVPVKLCGFEEVMPRGTTIPRIYGDYGEKRQVQVVFGQPLGLNPELYPPLDRNCLKAATKELHERLVSMG